MLQLRTQEVKFMQSQDYQGAKLPKFETQSIGVRICALTMIPSSFQQSHLGPGLSPVLVAKFHASSRLLFII